MIDSSLPFARFLQLVGPAFPGAAFIFADGVQRAVEERIIVDEVSTLGWIGQLLEFDLGRFEAPLLARLVDAWAADDGAAVFRLNESYLAGRESEISRNETVQAGRAMVRLLGRHPGFPADIAGALETLYEPALPTVWGAAAAAWEVGAEDAVAAYLWAWAEHQTGAAMKAVPLDESSVRRILTAVSIHVPRIAGRARALEPRSRSTPSSFAAASLQYQMQYSRLLSS